MRNFAESGCFVIDSIIMHTTRYYFLVLYVFVPLSALAFMPSLQMNKKSFISRYFASKTDLGVKTVEKLRGKNAIITGASSGLGKAIALQLAKCELKHMVISGRNIEALDAVRIECEKESQTCRVHVIPCDLADLKASQEFATEALNRCEKCVDLLVLNGGMSSRSSFLETGLEVDENLMKVNFLSGAAIAKCVVPSMVERQRGSLVWISSVQGLIGTPFRTSYAASKFAVQGYCEALRSELSSCGIAVHCVSPGYINTNLSLNAINGDGSKYGKMDKSTANGADPFYVATEILDSVVQNKKSDFIVAATPAARIAIALKFFAPNFLDKLLSKRFISYKKLSKE
jgi:Short-chain dehydrogenases of various substrate specificities